MSFDTWRIVLPATVRTEDRRCDSQSWHPWRRSLEGWVRAATGAMQARAVSRSVNEVDQSQRETVRKYFERLSLPAEEVGVAHKAALERAHGLRKFEIENYWKRSSYFWGFQLVAFGALALSTKDGIFHPPIVLIVAVLGALAALTALLSAKGSKFWQANWEAHVDFLETAVEGKLHTTALLDKRISFSVSRVNERFLETLLVGWVLAFIAGALTIVFPELTQLDQRTASIVQIAVPALAFSSGAVWLTAGQRSRLNNRAFLRSTLDAAPHNYGRGKLKTAIFQLFKKRASPIESAEEPAIAK